MPRPKSQKTLDKEAEAAKAAEKEGAAGTTGAATEESKTAEGSKASAIDVDAEAAGAAKVVESTEAIEAVANSEVVIAEAETKTAMAEEKIKEANVILAETDAAIAEADAKVAKAEARVAAANAKIAEVDAVAKSKAVRAEKAARVAAEEEAANDASPWHVVKEQSDDDTTIEVCNIATSYQMPAAILLRCRIDGKIVGDVKLMTGLKVKQIKGIWKLQ